jgi:hypothetical protein
LLLIDHPHGSLIPHVLSHSYLLSFSPMDSSLCKSRVAARIILER